MRGMDGDVTFKAQSVVSSKIPLRHVQFHLLLDAGVLRLDPLSFTLPQGQLAGRVQIDASKDVPQSDIDMNIENVDLAQFKPASATDPPMEGMLAGRVQLHGKGLVIAGRSKKGASVAVAFAYSRGRQPVETADRHQTRESAAAGRYGDRIGDIVDARRGDYCICRSWSRERRQLLGAGGGRP